MESEEFLYFSDMSLRSSAHIRHNKKIMALKDVHSMHRRMRSIGMAFVHLTNLWGAFWWPGHSPRYEGGRLKSHLILPRKSLWDV